MRFIILFFIINLPVDAAGRDCLKEAHNFKLAHKVSMMWNSQLDDGSKSIAQICKEGDGDIDSTIKLNNILHRKGMAEYERKHTFTMGQDSDVWFEDLEGEISNDQLCKALDKFIKDNGDCTSPSDYLRSLKFDDYKDFEKICLKNLPEQQKRMIACRKQK